MISELQAKITKEGEVVQKEYARFSEWCEDRCKGLTNEIATSKAEVEDLKAGNAEEVASASASEEKVAESKAKKVDESDEVAGVSTKLDQMNAKSAQLKEEVAELESELSKLSKSKADMDKMRSEEYANYLANKAELNKGFDGLKAALKVLKEYYAKDGDHEVAEGSAGSVTTCSSFASRTSRRTWR